MPPAAVTHFADEALSLLCLCKCRWQALWTVAAQHPLYETAQAIFSTAFQYLLYLLF